jgi:hypothetical protein
MGSNGVAVYYAYMYIRSTTRTKQHLGDALWRVLVLWATVLSSHTSRSVCETTMQLADAAAIV